MAKSIKLADDVYIDSTGVMIRASSSTQRKTLAEFTNGMVNTMTDVIEGNSSLKFVFDNSTNAFLLSIGASDTISGIYGLGCTANGVAYYRELSAASAFTFTTYENSVRIANGNSNNARVLILVVTGNVNITT
nr:MAG TPA: hypothetical protein [Bacteriophage sp.]